MTDFRHGVRKWTHSDRFLLWNATNACFWHIFQAGDHSPRFQKYNAHSLAEMSRWWNFLDRSASAQSGGVRPVFFFQNWQIIPHCEVDSVNSNLEWNRISQWEREKPWKRPLMFVKGKVYSIPSVLLWSHRERNELRGCVCFYVKIVSQGFERIFRRNGHFGSFKDVPLAA